MMRLNKVPITPNLMESFASEGHIKKLDWDLLNLVPPACFDSI
jgi:hypothetical protein